MHIWRYLLGELFGILPGMAFDFVRAFIFGLEQGGVCAFFHEKGKVLAAIACFDNSCGALPPLCNEQTLWSGRQLP